MKNEDRNYSEDEVVFTIKSLTHNIIRILQNSLPGTNMQVNWANGYLYPSDVDISQDNDSVRNLPTLSSTDVCNKFKFFKFNTLSVADRSKSFINMVLDQKTFITKNDTANYLADLSLNSYNIVGVQVYEKYGHSSIIIDRSSDFTTNIDADVIDAIISCLPR